MVEDTSATRSAIVEEALQMMRVRLPSMPHHKHLTKIDSHFVPLCSTCTTNTDSDSD